MPIHWENSVVVDRPVDEIWAVLMDFFNAPRLGRREGLLSMRQTSGGPMGLGSTYSERRSILGFETRLTARVTEWDPPHAISVTMEGRPFRSLSDRFTLEADPGGTTVAEVLEFELRSALKLLWPVIGPVIRRRRRAAFDDLKTLLVVLDPQASRSEAQPRD
jgi:hypothetical protein